MNVIFDTERLLFREFTVDDGALIYKLNSDPNVTRYLHEPLTTIEVAQDVLSNVILPQYKMYNYGRWAVHLKSTLEFIGWCGLKTRNEDKYPDLGYRFIQIHWGKGYATEAAKRTIEYGFMVLELPKIIAAAHLDNEASIRVLEKCGMEFKGYKVIDNTNTKYYELQNTFR